jgi:hypothetical protein
MPDASSDPVRLVLDVVEAYTNACDLERTARY